MNNYKLKSRGYYDTTLKLKRYTLEKGGKLLAVVSQLSSKTDYKIESISGHCQYIKSTEPLLSLGCLAV